MNRINLVAVGAALLVAGSAAHAQSKSSSLDRMFAVTVSQGNMAEVMSSQLALKKTSSEKVRKIATMLIQQHGQAETSLKKVAAQEKIMLPSGTDAKHREMYKKLEGMSGAGFDKEYIAAQVGDHFKTIALFNKELTGGTDTAIRSFATRYLPDIETHTQMITAVASNYGIPVGSSHSGGKMGKAMAMPADGAAAPADTTAPAGAPAPTTAPQ